MRNILLFAVFALSACATKMTENDCAGADWSAIGERDGLYGEGPEKLSERTAQCAEFGLPANAESYQAGRLKGLATYCTPEAGFDAGRNGRAYRGVCPAETESAFLAEYNIGRRLHDFTKAVENANSSYESALSTLQSSKYDLREAFDRYNDESLAEDQRREAGKKIDRLRREIDRLESDLPRLDREIGDAEGALADYRAFLDRR